MKKIEDFLVYPLNKLADGLTKYFTNKKLIIWIEVILFIAYCVLCKGFAEAFTRIYANTMVGTLTGMMFSFADGKFMEALGIETFVPAGFLLVFQAIYINVLTEQGVKGVRFWIQSLLFTSSMAILLEALFKGLQFIGDKVAFLGIIILILQIYLGLISIVQFIGNIKLLVKVVFIGLILEYVVLGILFIAMIPCTFIISYGAVAYFKITHADPTAFITSLRTLKENMLYSEMGSLYKQTVMAIVFTSALAFMQAKEHLKNQNEPEEDSEVINEELSS